MTIERRLPAEPTPSLNRARKLFFLSFEHSQGNTSLQKNIFDYLHHLHPDWIMDDDFKQELSLAATNPILKFALPREGKPLLHTADGEVAALDKGGCLVEIGDQLNTMQQSLNAALTPLPRLLELAAHMVGRDQAYLQRGRPRKFSSAAGRAGPKADRWLSYFVFYGLERHPTGLWEYDRMYADVVAAVHDSLRLKIPPEPFCDSLYRNLRQVITLYEQHHPELERSPSVTKLLSRLPVAANEPPE